MGQHGGGVPGGGAERMTTKDLVLSIMRSQGAADALDPVSYTHLDVYKRQILYYGVTTPVQDGQLKDKNGLMLLDKYGRRLIV